GLYCKTITPLGSTVKVSGSSSTRPPLRMRGEPGKVVISVAQTDNEDKPLERSQIRCWGRRRILSTVAGAPFLLLSQNLKIVTLNSNPGFPRISTFGESSMGIFIDVLGITRSASRVALNFSEKVVTRFLALSLSKLSAGLKPIEKLMSTIVPPKM